MEWVWAVIASTTATGLALALWRSRVLLGKVRSAAAADAERQREIFDGLDIGLVVYDPSDRLLVWNHDFELLYGRLAPRLKVGLRFEDLLRAAVSHGEVPEAVGREDAWIADRMASHRRPQQPLPRQMADGRWRRIVERFLPDGSMLSYSVDVTEMVLQEQALQAARREAHLAVTRLEDAIEALPAAFELYDAEDRVLMSNARMREQHPLVSHLLPGRPTFEALVRANAALGGLPTIGVSVDEWLADRLPQRRNPGAPRVVELNDGTWVRMHERRTREGGLVGIRMDVTELVRREHELSTLNTQLDAANRRLSELSETDALTGIAKRRLFDRRLHEEWSRAQRHDLPLTLLLIDVDHFKRYNDRHGHVAGDACLRRVAALLRTCARRPDELLVRYGGEEFVVLLPHTGAAEGRARAERCLAAMDAADIPHEDSPLGTHLTLSIGVGTRPTGPQGEEDAMALLRRADAALYRAKREGRHRVVSDCA